MKNSTDVFANAPVPKAVLINAVPSIVSMIMVLIYNLADAFFIGRTGVEEMFSAVSLATPAFFIFMSVGMLFGIGGTSLISRRLGEGNEQIVKKISSFCFWTGAVIGVIATAAIWIFLSPICTMIGANPAKVSAATINYTKSYFSIVSLSLPFLIVSNSFGNIIRAEGRANVAMIGNILGNLVNVVLDPIMILVFGWGIEGAAIATVLGNVSAALFYTVHLASKRSILSINPRNYSVKNGIFSEVMKIGVPASINSMLLSVSQIVVNNFMANFGDSAVGGLGVAFKVNTITVMLLIGLGTGIQPLLGYSYGARNVKRFAAVMKFSVLCAIILSVVMSAVSYFAAKPLVEAFVHGEQEVYGSLFVKILVISGPILGTLFVFINALQAMGAAGPSLILSASRQGIIYLPILIIINTVIIRTGSDAAWALVVAQPVTDYLATILAAVLFAITYKKFKNKVAAERAAAADANLQNAQTPTAAA